MTRLPFLVVLVVLPNSMSFSKVEADWGMSLTVVLGEPTKSETHRYELCCSISIYVSSNLLSIWLLSEHSTKILACSSALSGDVVAEVEWDVWELLQLSKLELVMFCYICPECITLLFASCKYISTGIVLTNPTPLDKVTSDWVSSIGWLLSLAVVIHDGFVYTASDCLLPLSARARVDIPTRYCCMA